MASFNKLTLIGRLGADAEMRYTPSGAPVTTVNMAVNDRKKDANGERQETTQWFRLTFWNKQAETAGEYLKKGQELYVEGPLSVREFEGKDGTTKFSLEVTVREFQMLGRTDAGDGSGQQRSSEGRTREPVGAGSSGKRGWVGKAVTDEELDVPF